LCVGIVYEVIRLLSTGGHFDAIDRLEAFLVTEGVVVLRYSVTVPSGQKPHFDVRYSVYSNKALQTGKQYDQITIPLEPVYTMKSLLLCVVAVLFYMQLSFSRFLS
jgi:hypothetical protein